MIFGKQNVLWFNIPEKEVRNLKKKKKKKEKKKKEEKPVNNPFCVSIINSQENLMVQMTNGF